jgi:hypothetical protein
VSEKEQLCFRVPDFQPDIDQIEEELKPGVEDSEEHPRSKS